MSATDGGRRPRQVALAVACLLALLVAAVATPGVVGIGSGGDAGDGAGSGNGDGGESDGDGGDGGGGVGIDDLIRWLFGDGGDPADRPDTPEYDVTVTPDPVPGRTVTVTVRRDGVPVENARVAFDGRPVGRTNATGRVRGTVPYADDLTVSVTPPGGATTGTATGTAHVTAAVAGSTPSGSGAERGNVTERYSLPTRATVAVRGTPDPGATVTVVARVEGVPVRNATVAANGERVGRTDDRGRHELRVPDDGTEHLDIRVSRGAVGGEATVAVRILRAEVRPADPVAVPTRPATVAARIGDDTAANATVRVAGRDVATTGDDGLARFALPTDPTAEVVVTSGDRTTRRPVTPLYAATVAVLGPPALALVGAAAVAVRRRQQVARGARRAAAVALRVGRTAVHAVVVTASVLIRGLGALVRGSARLVRGIARLVREAPGTVARALPGPRTLAARSLALPRLLARTPRRIVGGLFGTRGDGGDASTRTNDGADATSRGVRARWRTFARLVLPGRWRRRTPGEVARAAVDRGMPRAPVLTVTEAFRELEYGSGTLPDGERERARAAFATLLDRRPADEQAEERRSDGGDAE